ncbi:VPS10 domain-containing receptor SorCS1 [Thelohanellus kitauei]|uniref:VPS10 domain-containing receptor SorCS1 n=1 Tax=Thelohanellus kitauei TaxID=669202 RepID=A0A0C2MTG6_THEKT|nr:VPS10 domain-containing receptor SorCS1 [Thelohanellus kitauei]
MSQHLHICPILIHPKLPGVIFANFKPALNQFATYFSRNNGKTFEKMKYDSNNDGCVDNLCDAKLHLPCYIKPNVFCTKEWIITMAGENKNSELDRTQYFVTFNAGSIWKKVPFSKFAVKTMNGGGIIVGLNLHTNKVVYSFDEGKTYSRLSIYDDDEIIIEAAKIGIAENERLVIYGRDSNRSTLIITHYVLKYTDRTCVSTDYSPWSLVRSKGNCYQGKSIVYMKKNIDSMCMDNQTNTIKISTPCLCNLNDFHW